MSNARTQTQRDRLHIDVDDGIALGRWAKEMGVTREQLRAAIDKVGNNAVAVRKQLTQIDPVNSA